MFDTELRPRSFDKLAALESRRCLLDVFSHDMPFTNVIGWEGNIPTKSHGARRARVASLVRGVLSL